MREYVSFDGLYSEADEIAINKELDEVEEICSNCMGYVACYRGEEPTKKQEQKAKNCKDFWVHYSYLEDILEKLGIE